MNAKRDYKRAEEVDSNKKESRKSCFFNHIVFTILCCVGNIAFAGQLAYLGAAISMIEKRFQMRSTQSGLLFTINDVVGLCTVLFITHFGQKGNRPRVICVLYMTSAIGSLITTVPNFLYDSPHALRVDSNVNVNGVNDTGLRGTRPVESITCDAGTNVKNAVCDEERISQSGALMNEAWWLFLGQAMSGLSSAIAPLIITFLDDNMKKKNTPVYIGLIFSSWTIGIVSGFFLANFCLRQPVTFPNIDPKTTILDPRDPRFLGAWWLGLVIFGVFIIVVTFPLFFFPKKLPGSPADEEGKFVEGDKEEFVFGVGALKDFLQASKRILTNFTVIPLILSTCLGILSFVGLRAFGTKYFQTQFDVPTSQASFLIGIIIIPCAIFGNVTGGIIVKKFSLQKRGMVTLAMLLSSSLVVLIPFFFLAGCPQKLRAGLSLPYSVNNNATVMATFDLPNLDASCNEDCECPSTYRPVCGSDGITYASPCHAGCVREAVLDSDDFQNVTVFTDCNCIPPSENFSEAYATPGECSQDCSFVFHLSLGLLLSTFASLATAPTALLKIRCVDERDRSLVLGFVNVMTKLLGYIPGPVLWGALIDRACLLFQESCDKKGYCMVYDTDKFRTFYYSAVLAFKIIDVICLGIAFATIMYGLKKAQKYLAMEPQKVADVNGKMEGDEIEETTKEKKEQTYTTV